MNRLTTILLFVFLLGLGVFYYVTSQKKPDPKVSAPGKVSIVSQYDSAAVTELFFEDLKRGTRVSFQRPVGGAWEMTVPLKYPADGAVIDSILAPFQYNECIVVADLAKKPELKLEEYGLKTPRVVMRITLRGTSKEVLIGDEDVTGDQIFILSENRVLRTSRNLHNATQRNQDELRSKVIFTIDVSTLREVEADGGQLNLRLVLGQQGWQIDSPWKEKADSASANLLINQIYGLRVKRFHEDHPGQDIAQFQAPLYRIILRSADHQQELRIVTDTGGTLVARLEGVPFLWELAPESIILFNRPSEEFRDHSFFRYFRDELSELRLGTPSGEIVFAKKINAWNLVAPREYPLEKNDFEDLLGSLEKLSATGFVDRVNQPWSAFGLEATPYWVQVSTRSGSTTKVWLGEIDGKGNRYARRENEDSVVLISEHAIPFLDGSVFDFVSKQILDVAEMETRLIELISREGAESRKISWQRDDGNNWRRMTPTGDVLPQEDKKFASQLDMFLHWKADRVVTDNPAGFHFETPLYELRYFSSITGTEQTLQHVVPIVRNAKGEVFVASKKNMVYELPSRIVEKLKSFFD